MTEHDSPERPSREQRAFDPAAIPRTAADALSVSRVFGTAYERDGVLVIPVAKSMGGTWSGSGDSSAGGVFQHREKSHGEAAASGSGGGFGVRVRAVGVYVVDDTGVHWRPALDLNRVILGGQAVGIIVAVALSWALRSRHAHRWHHQH